MCRIPGCCPAWKLFMEVREGRGEGVSSIGGDKLPLLLWSGPFEPCLELFGGIGRTALDSFSPLCHLLTKQKSNGVT